MKNDPFLRAPTPPTVISSSELHRRLCSSPFYKCFLNILISQPARADLLPSSILWWDPGQRIQVLAVSGFYSRMQSVTCVVTGCACVCAKSLQWCLTLWDPMDCSPTLSSVPGILQARILQGVAMPASRGSSPSRIEPKSFTSPASADGFFTAEPPGKPCIKMQRNKHRRTFLRETSNI